MSEWKNALPLVHEQWSECVTCIDCSCGATELILSESGAEMICECGRVYRLSQHLEVKEPDTA